MGQAGWFIESFSILILVKWLMVILLLVYMVFAGLMTMQIKAMTRAINMKDDYIITVLGLINFVMATVIFLLAVLIL